MQPTIIDVLVRCICIFHAFLKPITFYSMEDRGHNTTCIQSVRLTLSCSTTEVIRVTHFPLQSFAGSMQLKN